MSRDFQDEPMGTADLAAAGERQDARMQSAAVADTGVMQGGVQPHAEAAVPAAYEDAPDTPGRAAHPQPPSEQLAALFPPDLAQRFRSRWDTVQIGFVDDPRATVRQADELVAEVMQTLARSFADQRAELEAELGQGDQASTENLRLALRRYRSFFQRLLSL